MKEEKFRKYALLVISALFVIFYAGIARNMHTLRVYQDNLSVFLLHFDIFVQIFTFACWYKIYSKMPFSDFEKNIYILCGLITLVGNAILYVANFVVWMGVEPWPVFWLWFVVNGLGIVFPIMLFFVFKKNFLKNL